MATQDFNLPDLNKVSDGAQHSAAGIGPLSSPISLGTSEINSKEMVIAFGAVLAAGIIFFIVKNYVSKMLVASYKKSPRSADMAGWSLFCILFLASIAVALWILDPTKFLSLPYLIPLGLAVLASFIMFMVALLSKH